MDTICQNFEFVIGLHVILKYKAKNLRMWHVGKKYFAILNPLSLRYDKVPHWKYYFLNIFARLMINIHSRSDESCCHIGPSCRRVHRRLHNSLKYAWGHPEICPKFKMAAKTQNDRPKKTKISIILL